jgi:hypothetical protein
VRAELVVEAGARGRVPSGYLTCGSRAVVSDTHGTNPSDEGITAVTWATMPTGLGP